MPVAVGEHLLITKNNRGANLRNGELCKVAAMDEDRITLDNGRQLNTARPLHVRQGYSVTSQTSQSHESVKMFGFLPVSSTSQINVVQMLVSLRLKLPPLNKPQTEEARRSIRPAYHGLPVKLQHCL